MSILGQEVTEHEVQLVALVHNRQAHEALAGGTHFGHGRPHL